MELISELSYCYIKCDICGDGYNRASVYKTPGYTNIRYRYLRGSACYGAVDKDNLTGEELLELLEKDHFMVATREVRRQYNRLIREIKRNNRNHPTEEIIEAGVSGWEDALLVEDHGDFIEGTHSAVVTITDEVAARQVITYGALAAAYNSAGIVHRAERWTWTA